VIGFEDERIDRQECTCLQRLGRDGEARHVEAAENDLRGSCRRVESEVEGSADGRCWSICRPCLAR
jgi:hypothetical protein